MKKTTLLLAVLIFTYSTAAFAYTTLFVVNCRESITLRESPSVYAAEIVQIPLGQAVSYLGDAGNGFYKINYDGLIGYALAQYLSSRSTNNSARYGTVVNCRKSITLRTSPSIHAEEIIQMPLGARVRFLGGAANDFFKVEYQGLTGYALRAYIELD